ncbi:hypothetical protein [Herbidospora mongoliensis]|uniref:hypothetical protein n=1 Tax=Herbidospora mongoliensis TaxID=688067 RepID=UPI000ACD6C77|nr:hypothetical protein [Herbidospora mongoliensis]
MNEGRRKGLFIAAVVVLAALGIYLTTLGDGSGEVGESGEAGPTGSAATRTVTAPPVAVPSQVATTPSADFDVYSYLPLSREQLGAAADLARRFTVAYGTYTYNDPVGRADRLKAFTTVEFGDDLTRTVTSPAAVEHDTADQVVSKGAARLRSIRDMSADSVVVVVEGTQRITALSGAKDQVEEYAVTVVQVGADWRVYDLQLAGSGQDGDVTP